MQNNQPNAEVVAMRSIHVLLLGAALAASASLASGCGPKCGNNRLNEGEQCDGTPNCRDDCTLTMCGDGLVEGTEECDEGVNNSDETPDACRTNCRLPSCPDGVVDMGEECDGGCECDFDCRITGVCGDGNQSVCELCDDGAANSDTAPDACRTDCVPASCGDGVTDTGEECDDGDMNSDVIANRCRRTGCALPSCGDFVIDMGEECDGGLGCGPTCLSAVCGDGNVDAGEACDDGVANSDLTPDACRLDCTLPICGDGTVDPVASMGGPEECDDGGFVTGDGCNALCEWENSCFNPVGPMGPDNNLEPGEECDDGNPDTGDGCDMCLFEAGTACDAAIDLDDPGVAMIMGSDHVYMGTTAAASDFAPMMCAAGLAADDVHSVYLLQDSLVEAYLSAPFTDVLYARRDCLDMASETACASDTGSDPALSFTGAAGDTWFVIVDGATGTDVGTYTLTVTVRPLRAAGQECDVGAILNVCTPGLICVDDGSGIDGFCG